MKSDDSARARGKIRRVGLISPCSGNLGNAAIMTSMIENLRARIPGLEIVGVTLSEEDTARRHGIATFPITGTTHGKYYSLATPAGDAGSYKDPAPAVASLKAALKQIGWLRKIIINLRIVRLELKHIFRSARLVSSLDRVVVTGGGALDDFWGGPWGHPWTLFKFTILGRLFRVPVLFVSVGMCTLDHRLSRLFVHGALRFSRYRSYRDVGSDALVKAMFPHVSGSVWPDLAYGYRCPELPPTQRRLTEGNQLLIAASPIAFCDPRSWPVSDAARYSRYLEELARFLIWTASAGHELMLFATDGCDIESLGDLVRILSNESIDTTRIQILASPPAQTTEELLKGIAPADIVIASRLHGVMLSHLIAKPVIALSFDRKVVVHMTEIGQQEYCLNIDNFTSQTLEETFAKLKEDREPESARLVAAVRQLRIQAQAQYNILFGERALKPEAVAILDSFAAKVQA